MTAIRAPRPTFDAAARRSDGKLNLDLQQSLIGHDSRLEVVERALGIGGLDPDKKTKLAPVPPRADVEVTPGAGQFTVSLTNPEFIRGRGNPLRNPIYHKIRFTADPTFRSGVKELPPSVQTHWPILAPTGSRLYVQVLHSFDGINWTLPISKGPYTV